MSVRGLLAKLNQKGSTLLMVIICLAFLGILGSLMLSVSMINLEMKTVESKSNMNFYTCEKALEEIKAGLEELTISTIQTEYENVLEHYVDYTSLSLNSRNEEVQTKVMDSLQARLGSDKNMLIDRFTKYLSVPSNYTIQLNSVPYEVDSTGHDWLVFKNVNIRYASQGYQNVITSDIRISIPDFTFTATAGTISKSMDQYFKGYALVADGAILCENNSGVTTVTGNVYSGDSIKVRDTLLSDGSYEAVFNGNYLSTRGNIEAKDTASLRIGNILRPFVWANNIVTDSTSNYIYSNHAKTNLDINAICLVKDDLTVNARNSNVKLSGAYVGYSVDDSISNLGSSIIINGSGSAMDLSGLSSLVLAGRAYVTVDSSVDTSISDINILTGESLALKSNQPAYMVPGKYITLNNGPTSVVALHNPITVKDILTGTPSVSIANSTDPAQLNYYSYIDPASQYKMVAKQTTLGTVSTLRYYYLNFASGIQADKFMVNYIDKYPSNLQITDSFPLGNIILPDTDNIISAGNIMGYNTANSTPIIYKAGMSSSYYFASDYAAKDTVLNNLIQSMKFSDISDIYTGTDLCSSDKLQSESISTLPNLFNNMTHYLSKNEAKDKRDNSDTIVGTTVLDSGVREVNSSYATGYTLNSGFKYYNSTNPINPLDNTSAGNADEKSVVVLSGDAAITEGSHFNGILITTGNVTIGKNAVINGIIIAAGHTTVGGKTTGNNVTVGSGAKVYGRIIATGNIVLGEGSVIDCTQNTAFTDTALNMTVDAFLENIFKKDANILWKMFINPQISVNITPGGTTSDLVNLTNLVSSENWRNN